MVSNVGEAAVSAVSLVDGINILLINIFAALGTGGAVVAAQFIGQGSHERARYSAKQLIMITAILSAIIMLVVIAVNGTLLHLIFGDVDIDVMKNAVNFIFYFQLYHIHLLHYIIQEQHFLERLGIQKFQWLIVLL